MGLLARLLQPILNALNAWLGPLRKLWEKLVATWEHMLSVGEDTKHLVLSVQAEIEGWRTFTLRPKVRNRVISLPLAVDKTKALIQGIPDSWRAIVDLFNQLRDKIQTSANPKSEGEEFAADLESGEGVAGLLKRLPKLAKGLEKMFGFLAIVLDALETISSAIQDLQTIVDEASRIRKEIEDLDTIFLSQRNKRRTVRTVDGESLKLRVGSLHS